jgi:hypothetical protein
MPKIKKKKGVAKLKKDLWKYFALYIKQKYSVDDGWVRCYTCDASLQIGTSNCQAGHWLPKKGYPVHYFNEDNVRPQCYHCNISLSGNTAVFERKLKDEIGGDKVNEMYESRHESIKRTREWYEEQINYYRGQVYE